MEKININVITSGVLTSLVYLLGGFDIALQTLLLCIIIDYITGVLKAGYEGKLNSKVGLKGIIKKIGYLILVVLVTQLDILIGDTGFLRTPIIYIFVANEGLSIIENWGTMGLPIPKFLLNKLEQLKDRAMENDSHE